MKHIDLNVEANRFIYDSKVGDFYMLGTIKKEVVKRTPNRIHFSDGFIVSIKTLNNGFKYLTSKSVVTKHKSYPLVYQVIRDIEGYLLYKIHANSNIFK